MNPLERRYRRLLAWYPRDHRAAHEEEMVGVLLAGADGSRGRPGFAVSADLLRGALALHLRRVFGRGSGVAWRDASALAGVVGAVFLLSHSVATMVRAGRRALAGAMLGAGQQLTSFRVLVPLVVALVLVIALTCNLCRVAAAAGWVLFVVQCLVFDGAGYPLDVMVAGKFAVDLYAPLLLALVTAVVLTTGLMAGVLPRRGVGLIRISRWVLLGCLAVLCFAASQGGVRMRLPDHSTDWAVSRLPLIVLIAVTLGLALGSAAGRRAVALLAIPACCQVVGLASEVSLINGPLPGLLVVTVPASILIGLAWRAAQPMRRPLGRDLSPE